MMKMSGIRLGRERRIPVLLNGAAGNMKVLLFLFGEVDGLDGLSLSL